MDTVLGVGSYVDALAVSERTEWDGVVFYSLSLTALIAAKRATGRKKDREHVLELEAMHELQQRR
jgi:predicted nucleotidyltransferase